MYDRLGSCQENSVPLLDNTIQTGIQDCAPDELGELVWRPKLSKSFTIQLDKSTDVNLTILLAFVLYVYEGEFEKDLCKSTEAQTGENIFEILYQFFINHQTDWNKCIDVCSDSADSMTGKTVDAMVYIKNVSKMCASSHCILHRHVLVVMTMPNSYKSVLGNALLIC
jgi:hypothetical protein